MRFFILSVVLAVALPLAAADGTSESDGMVAVRPPSVLELSRQRVRIRRYDGYLLKVNELAAEWRKAKRTNGEVQEMLPSDRAVYDDLMARLDRRLAEARKRLADHRATMTEDDFAKIRERDAQAAKSKKKKGK